MRGLRRGGTKGVPVPPRGTPCGTPLKQQKTCWFGQGVPVPSPPLGTPPTQFGHLGEGLRANGAPGQHWPAPRAGRAQALRYATRRGVVLAGATPALEISKTPMGRGLSAAARLRATWPALPKPLIDESHNATAGLSHTSGEPKPADQFSATKAATPRATNKIPGSPCAALHPALRGVPAPHSQNDATAPTAARQWTSPGRGQPDHHQGSPTHALEPGGTPPRPRRQVSAHAGVATPRWGDGCAHIVLTIGRRSCTSETPSPASGVSAQVGSGLGTRRAKVRRPRETRRKLSSMRASCHQTGWQLPPQGRPTGTVGGERKSGIQLERGRGAPAHDFLLGTPRVARPNEENH